MTVANPDGQSATKAAAFTYQAPKPTIGTLSPATGTTAGGTDVTITGTGFQAGAVVTFGGTTGTLLSQTATTLVARTPARAAGAVSVTVANPDGQSATKAAAFTYQTPPALPVVSGMTPLSGTTAGNTLVTITGSNFKSGAAVTFGALAGTVVSATTSVITVRTPAHVVGSVVVSVTNTDGKSAQGASSFTYVKPDAPTITSFAPAFGPADGGTDVTITGSGFASGVIVRFGPVAGTLLDATSTRLVVRTPAHAKGLAPISVTNPDGQGVQLPNAFTFRGKPPAVTSVSPSSGTSAGGTVVTIDGTDFDAGVSVSVDQLPAAVVSVTATRIRVTMPAHAPATVGLTITNPDSQLAWVPGAFTYESDGPAITSVLPAEGSTAGGTSVTIVGSGFSEGVSVRFDGVAASVVSWSTDMITVLTPAHDAGAVSVLVMNADGGSATSMAAFTYESPEAPFVRYFAEGSSGAFFHTRFALSNPHAEPVPVTVTFTDTQGTATPLDLVLPAQSRMTLDESNRPALASEAFATRFEAPEAIGVERTMTWAAGGPAYGAHSDTGVAAPRTSWVLAEGATTGDFNTFYLLQNPTTEVAQVKVQYLLATGERIEKVHPVAPLSRTNIWVNKDDPRLAAAEMSATLTSVNGVPVVVERSMYRNSATELFTAGHNSAAVATPALRWFLAEGATGGTFDEFVLVANPNTTAATLQVSYLRAGVAPIVKTYVAAPQSRLTIWVDQEDAALAQAEVSIVVESLTPTPVVVERSMWWRATPTGEWVEAHNSGGVTSTAPRWLVADGEAGGPEAASTYVLVANTGAAPAAVRFTLLSEQGPPRTVEDVVSGNGRYSLDVAGAFPGAGRRFSVLVESVSGTAPLVVERASYSSTPTTPWASGTNSLALPLPAVH